MTSEFIPVANYAYAFECEMSWEEMLEALASTPWRWMDRVSDRWERHLLASALGEPHSGSVMIIDEDDQLHVNVRLLSESENEVGVRFLFESVRDVILLEVFPAIGATNIRPAEFLER